MVIRQHLYLKILFAFMGILTITTLLTIGLFLATAGRTYRSYLDQQTIGKLKVFQVMVQKELDRHKDLPAQKNPDVAQLLETCTALFGVKLWLTDPCDRIILQSFEGSVDFLVNKGHRHIQHDSGITLYHYILKWEKYYAIIPIDYRDQALRLHFFVDTHKTSRHEALFLTGVIAIGIRRHTDADPHSVVHYPRGSTGSSRPRLSLHKAICPCEPTLKAMMKLPNLGTHST